MTLSTSGNRCIAPFLRGYGQTRFLSQETPRSGEQAALGADLLALMDSLSIEKAILGGYDWLAAPPALLPRYGRKGAGTGQRRGYLQQPGHRWRRQSGFARSGGARPIGAARA
jgi:hypothetical protein